MNRAEILKHQVVILGFGREGRATFEALGRAGEVQAVTVWAESGQIPEGPLARCAPFDERLCDFDIAIRSPGIPVEHPALRQFKAAGGVVLNPSSIWFAEQPDVSVIGVTGSKGKSTTTAMIHHLLGELGLPAHMAGNIGKPLISLIDKTFDPQAWVVAELSSYQLADLTGQLRLGLITRLFPEHVNWHGTVHDYYAAKLRLFDLAQPNPVLVNARDAVLMDETTPYKTARPINQSDPSSNAHLHRLGEEILLGEEMLLRLKDLNLRGSHNLDNLVMAFEALAELGVIDSNDYADLIAPSTRFCPLEHRLSPIYQQGLVTWINDSIATTPHATVAALQSVQPERIILIIGGFERQADWTVVIEHLRAFPIEALVTLPDNGPEVANLLVETGAVTSAQVHHANNMSDAVAQAQIKVRQLMDSSKKPCSVLLSPGAPSFGHYTDFEERGRAFGQAVMKFSQEE